MKHTNEFTDKIKTCITLNRVNEAFNVDDVETLDVEAAYWHGERMRGVEVRVWYKDGYYIIFDTWNGILQEFDKTDSIVNLARVDISKNVYDFFSANNNLFINRK